MVEYVIEIVLNDAVEALIHVERDGRHTTVKPTVQGYSHVSKFRVKERAEKVAAKHENSRVVATYGGFVYGTKRLVSPKQPDRKRSPYRSI